jgi:hypothetical protein
MTTDRGEFFQQIGAALGVPLMPGDVCLTDAESGKNLIVARGDKVIWFIDRNRVNLSHLLSPNRNGKIVLCDGDPHECVMVYEVK